MLVKGERPKKLRRADDGYVQAELAALAKRVDEIQARPQLVRGRRLRKRDRSEDRVLPTMWSTACGWRYGASKISRASPGPEEETCKRCHPNLRRSDVVDSSSSEETSGAETGSSLSSYDSKSDR